jgi:glycosyltransferase involved in cell wall biosynthesis
MTLVVNSRFRKQRATGVQRVATELVDRLRTPKRELVPAGRASGLQGHLWEQLRLPVALRGGLLWSPGNVGPVAVKRQVLTIHDAAVLDHPEWFAPSFVRAYRAIWSLLVNKVAGLVTVSEFTRQRLSVHFDRPVSSISVVPNAASSSFRPATASEIEDVRSRFGLGDAPYFLTLGTREPRKNLGLVQRAWARARPRLGADCRLAVVGAQGSSEIFSSARRLDEGDGVHVLGRVDDAQLPALLSGAQALIYPSFYEGFGLPVLEAMACGAPVITTRLASLPEVAGEAAIYVDPSDEDDLASAIGKVDGSSDLRRELGQRGHERARLFDWDKSARQMDALFAALA